MISLYEYNGQTYRLISNVRNAIYAMSRKQVLGAEPSTYEEKVAFWEQYGVTYSEIEDTYTPLERAKREKLKELETKFLQWYNSDATMFSKLGFAVDCDARANADVDGLIIIGQPAVFMDANNEGHEVTLDDLKVLQVEIKHAGIIAYEAKWYFRRLIESATTEDGVAVINIEFTPVDFSTASL